MCTLIDFRTSSPSKENDMKKLPALAGTLLVAALCVSGCAPAEENGGHTSAPISLGPDSFPSQSSEEADKATSSAALNLQLFFTTLDAETDALAVDIEALDSDDLAMSFPNSFEIVDDASISQSDAGRLILEYANNIETIPNKGFIQIAPKTLEASADGSVEVTGEDMFIIYRDGSKNITKKGASMTSEDSLNDVFTMAEVDGTWKITKISF